MAVKRRPRINSASRLATMNQRQPASQLRMTRELAARGVRARVVSMPSCTPPVSTLSYG